MPIVVTLTQNRPYVLRLENADRVSHVFRAPDFFRAIAIESATVGGQELTEACPKRIILEAEESAELRFVAIRDGHYDYKDAPFPVTFGGGAIGVISIEPRGDYTVGSLNPVKIEEPAPATTSTPATPVKTAPSDNPFDTYEPPADDAGKGRPESCAESLRHLQAPGR